MTFAVLIPGAGGLGWYWHLVERRLQARGYDAVAVDLASGGQTGLPAYADAVVDAINGRSGVVLVAQSMGAFTVPLVWPRVRARAIVFVNAMIPQPGETPGQWWENVPVQSRPGQPGRTAWLQHRVRPDHATSCMTSHRSWSRKCRRGPRDSWMRRFDDPCTFDAWPPVPIHVIAGRDTTGSSRLSCSNASPVTAFASIRSSCRAVISPLSATPRELSDVIARYLGTPGHSGDH